MTGIDPEQDSRRDATGTAGVVTSPHPLASEEGRRVLAAGGNAIEATVAMGAVLAVIYPHFCGLGGDAVWLVADRNGRADCFLGIGQAALDCSGYEGGVPIRGPRSAATTACLVDSWDHALGYSARHWSGAMSLGDLMERATELAETGFPLSQSQRFWFDFRKGELDGWPGFAATFDHRSSATDTFRQAHLAATLRTIATEGARSFYEGEIAHRVAQGLEQAGSPLRLHDLAATRTRQYPPLALDYHGHRLLAPPAPTQGVATLMAMGILERLDIASAGHGTADYYHLLVESIKQAFLRRDAISDPDLSEHSVEAWLAPETMAHRASKVDRGRALSWPRTFQTGDTVFLAATDAEGRSTSVLQSIYFDWGSGVVVGNTGILWQNRAGAFSTGVNAIRPGARPLYTLNPGIALRGGKPRILYGTQGADGQPQTLVALLTRLINFEMDPVAALGAPRFLLGRTFSSSRDSLKLEQDAGETIFSELAARGHEMAALPSGSPIAGQAGLILLKDGTAWGAHDPRGDGVALSV
jgi:gamma-glutamyltranspeptidase/glutathione hydrolase